MKYVVYSPPIGEITWDYTREAAGGSETYHIEIVERLARRGHEVVSYAPVSWPFKKEREHKGVIWRHSKNVRTDEAGIWIINRTPALADDFSAEALKQSRLWLICHDFDYGPKQMTQERLAKFEYVVGMSPSHAAYLQHSYPHARVITGSGGIALDRMEIVESSQSITRNPKAIIYASNPGRGLLQLLKIFDRARRV